MRGMVQKVTGGLAGIHRSKQEKLDREQFMQYLQTMMQAQPPMFDPYGWQKAPTTPYDARAQQAQGAYEDELE
jgi:hypothetical protein